MRERLEDLEPALHLESESWGVAWLSVQVASLPPIQHLDVGRPATAAALDSCILYKVHSSAWQVLGTQICTTSDSK